MEMEEIKLRLFEVLDLVERNDYYLLQHNVNERSIAHRLAVYLESQFEGNEH
jgi:hypothetical protein